MTIGYKIAYRLGLVPWERAGREATAQFTSLLAREEQGGAPYGRALDVGCGRGDHSITLARRGWAVTGVDAVPRAVATAAQKAADAGVDVRFLVADVTTLSESEVGSGYRLLLDFGCFHGLTAPQRAAYARALAPLTASGGTLLLMSFSPGGRGPLPRGADRDEIRQTFGDWTLLDDEPADTSGMPAPLKRTAPRWYRLRRN